MRVKRPALAAAVSLAWLASIPPIRAENTLSFCLDESGSAPAAEESKGARGLDLAIAQAVAQRLGRKPVIQPYETEIDSDNNPAEQINALLSDRRCQLVLGYPLFGIALGEPRAQRSRLPGYAGGKPADRRRWIKLSELVASRGYRFDPMVVVLGPGAHDRAIRTLADLQGAKLVVEERTLGDAILMAYDGGALIGQITHVTSNRNVFESLERGEYDATLVELHRLDAYLLQHPHSGLLSSGHYHSVGFNIGIVGLASEAALISEVNAAIGDMLDGGEISALARTAGVTYLPPREPNIAATTPAELRGD
jgi:ABC-type amino acid transport substrate-binding protein